MLVVDEAVGIDAYVHNDQLGYQQNEYVHVQDLDLDVCLQF